MRLINADALMTKLNRIPVVKWDVGNEDITYLVGLGQVLRIIDTMPTVNVIKEQDNGQSRAPEAGET